jgi:hypothetical protein
MWIIYKLRCIYAVEYYIATEMSELQKSMHRAQVIILTTKSKLEKNHILYDCFYIFQKRHNNVLGCTLLWQTDKVNP